MTHRKIALLGGTFDPIHLGHTAVAAAAAEHIGAEQVVFVPAKLSPLKNSLPQATDGDRLAMVALAIAQNSRFRLSDYEIRKPAPSYTLETVRHFRAEYGSDVRVCWLLGADSINDLPHWYRVTDLIDECGLCTMYRAGCEAPNFRGFEPVWGRERVRKLELNIIPTPLVDISSTEVRRRLAKGDDVSGLLAPAVADYIREHGLYRSKDKS